jgi:hypothetical protein
MRLRMRLSLYAPSISLFRGSDRPGGDGPAGVSSDVVAAVGRLRGGKADWFRQVGRERKTAGPDPTPICRSATSPMLTSRPSSPSVAAGSSRLPTHPGRQLRVHRGGRKRRGDRRRHRHGHHLAAKRLRRCRQRAGHRPAPASRPDERSGLGMAGGLLFAPEMTQWECGRL